MFALHARPVRLPRKVAAAAVVLSGLTGCYGKADGDRLAREARDREARLVALEQGIAEQREAMTASLAEARTKVTELEAVLERATDVVTRNSADLGTEVVRLREELQALRGTLAELEQRITGNAERLTGVQRALDERVTELARRTGALPAIDPSEVPEGADAIFSAAIAAHDASEHARARGLFQAFLQRHGEDPRADDARYRVGKSFLEEGRPRSALSEFRTVLADYPDSDVMDQVLFDMGDAFYRLHDCAGARTALEALLARYRRSPLRQQAQRKLREIRRAPASYCTS